MININLWNSNIGKNLINNRKILQLLNESFNSKKHLINNKTYVISLIKNNEIIGSISLIQNKDLICYLKSVMTEEEYQNSYIFRAGKGMYIYNLVVSKDYRGNGIAQRLLNIAIYISKLKNNQYCHASCENEISRHIFEKRGFKIEKHFTNSKGKDIKLMSSWI